MSTDTSPANSFVSAQRAFLVKELLVELCEIWLSSLVLIGVIIPLVKLLCDILFSCSAKANKMVSLCSYRPLSPKGSIVHLPGVMNKLVKQCPRSNKLLEPRS